VNNFEKRSIRGGREYLAVRTRLSGGRKGTGFLEVERRRLLIRGFWFDKRGEGVPKVDRRQLSAEEKNIFGETRGEREMVAHTEKKIGYLRKRQSGASGEGGSTVCRWVSKNSKEE